MFCQNCGKQIPDGSKFCGYCGTKLFYMEEMASADTQPAAGAAETTAFAGAGQPAAAAVETTSFAGAGQPAAVTAQAMQVDNGLVEETRRNTIFKLEEMLRRLASAEQYKKEIEELDEKIEDCQDRYSYNTWDYSSKRFHYVIGFLIGGSIGLFLGGSVSAICGAPFWSNLAMLTTVFFGVIGGVTKRICAKRKSNDTQASINRQIESLAQDRREIQGKLDACDIAYYSGFTQNEIPDCYRSTAALRLMMNYLEQRKAQNIKEALKLYKESKGIR